MTGAAGGGGSGAGAAGAGAPGAGPGAAPAAAPAVPSASPAVNHDHHEPDPFIEMFSGEDVIEDRKLSPLKAFQQRNRERLKSAMANVVGKASEFVQRTSQRIDWISLKERNRQLAEQQQKQAASDLAVRNLWKDQNTWAEKNRKEMTAQDALTDWTRHAGYNTEWPPHTAYKERMRAELHAHEPSRKSRNEQKSGMQHKNDNGNEMI